MTDLVGLEYQQRREKKVKIKMFLWTGDATEAKMNDWLNEHPVGVIDIKMSICDNCIGTMILYQGPEPISQLAENLANEICDQDLQREPMEMSHIRLMIKSRILGVLAPTKESK